MSRTARIRLVLRRDLRERLASRAFRITTAVLAVLAVGGVLAPLLLADGPSTVTLGFVGEQSQQLREATAAAASRSGVDEVDTVTLADRTAAEEQLADGRIDLALLGTDEVLVPDRGDLADDLATSVAGAAGLVTGLSQAGVEPATAATGLASPPLDIVAAEQSGADQARYWLVYGATFVLYMALVLYGNYIVHGVAEEKASRVVEVVVSTVRPVELLAGKTLAIGVLGIGQLVAITAPALIVAALTDQVSLPDGSVPTFFAALLWFVLGYAFYATLFAAAGATATRTQDAETVAQPVVFALGIAFIGGFFVVLSAPDGLTATILSYLPPTAPITMLARSALGGAAVWEAALSVAIMVVATIATIRLAARIYRGSLLQTGQRVSLAQAWRGAEA